MGLRRTKFSFIFYPTNKKSILRFCPYTPNRLNLVSQKILEKYFQKILFVILLFKNLNLLHPKGRSEHWSYSYNVHTWNCLMLVSSRPWFALLSRPAGRPCLLVETKNRSSHRTPLSGSCNIRYRIFVCKHFTFFSSLPWSFHCLTFWKTEKILHKKKMWHSKISIFYLE